MMLMGLNTPVRIGHATVLPGDVVLAKREGVIFIPAHLAEAVVDQAERIMLRDRFGHQRLREGTYTPGQIDTRWTKEIEEDFTRWLMQNKDRLDVPRTTIEALIRERSTRNQLSEPSLIHHRGRNLPRSRSSHSLESGRRSAMTTTTTRSTPHCSPDGASLTRRGLLKSAGLGAFPWLR